MKRHEQSVGRSQRDRGANSVTHNPERPDQQNTQNDVRRSLDHSDYRNFSMLAHPIQDPPGSKLCQHQRVRNDQGQQDRIALGNVPFSQPDFDDRPAYDYKRGGHGQSDERACPVSGDENLAKAILVAHRFRLARHGNEYLRQAGDYL
jgi:hypothetical protein